MAVVDLRFNVLDPALSLVKGVILFFQRLLEEEGDVLLQILGVVSVVLRQLASKYFAELMNFEICFRISSDALDYGGSPRDGKLSETVALIKVCVHILLHGLHG